MVRLALAIFLFISTSLSTASFAQDTPEEWYDQLIESNKLKGQELFPQTLIFVNSLPVKGPPQFKKDIEKAEFDSSSIFKLASAKSAEWNFLLNKQRYSKGKPKAIIFRSTEADSIIDIGNDWALYHKSSPAKPLVVLGAPSNETPSEIQALLISKLGWDGVILDVKKDKVLVGSTSEILSQPEIQALAVEGSANKIVIESKDRKGSGLLSLQKFSKGLGIFDVVFLGKTKNSIQPGTKLIIERKK